MSAKSRSSNGFWSSAMNLLSRLNPRQRGRCLGVASGNGFGARRRQAGAIAGTTPGPPPRSPGEGHHVGWSPQSRLRRAVVSRWRQCNGPGSGQANPLAYDVSINPSRSGLQRRPGLLTQEAGFRAALVADLGGESGRFSLSQIASASAVLPPADQVIGASEQPSRRAESIGG